MKYLSFKQPSEVYVQNFDFGPLLASGETVSWIGTSVTVGNKISAPSVVSPATDGGAIVQSTLKSDTVAKITLNNGTTDTYYKIQVLISTSAASVYEEDAILPCWAFQG